MTTLLKMRPALCAAAMLGAGIGGSAMGADSESRQPLRIAFISYANPQQVARDSTEVTAFLQEVIDRPVEGFVTTDYGSSIEAMRTGAADVAFVDPLAFMMAHEQIGAEPLLLEVYQGAKASYHASIWVRRDSGITSIQDLRDKTIAFADQVDMSGHLLPREVFVREGLVSENRLEGEFFERAYFAGGDEQAMRAMFNGYVDAAGVSQFAYLLLRPEEREHITSIAQSLECPSHLVIVRKDLDESVKERIADALRSLDPADADDRRLLDRLYGVEGFVDARLGDFAQVAQIAARYGFIQRPEVFTEAHGAP